MRRHSIDVYRPYDTGKMDSTFGILTVCFSVLAFIVTLWGTIVLLDPAIANSFGWVLLGNIPLMIHGVLAKTSAWSGVTVPQGRVLSTWNQMPRELRQNIPMPRSEVKRLDRPECNDLENKMDQAVSLRQRDTGQIANAHRYLDAAIEQYAEKELV